MKHFTFLSLFLASTLAINAQATYEVGAGKTHTSIKAAITAATTAEADGAEFTIMVDEGVYGADNKDIKISKAHKVTIVGAGADKSVIKFTDAAFDLTVDQSNTAAAGRVFQLNTSGHENISLTVKNMGFENIGFGNTNGGAVVNAIKGGQQIAFENCNFKNVYARTGGIIQLRGTSAVQDASLTMTNCYIENCGTIDNQNQGGLIQVETGSGVIKNCSFVNCTGEALNRGKVTSLGVEPGADGNYQNGMLIMLLSVAESLTIENSNFISNKYINGEITNYHPIISLKTDNAAPVVNIKNNVILNNLRGASLDCDILCRDDIVPTYEGNVISNIYTFAPQAEAETIFTPITAQEGCTFVGSDFSLADYFEMEGDVAAVSVDENGVKQLIRKETPTSVEKLTTTDAKIIATEGMLNVYSNDISNIAVYSIAGVKVADAKKTTQLQVELTTGIYIVSVNNKTTKVYVK